MRAHAHLSLTGRRLSAFALTALLSFFVAVGTSAATGKATTTKSLTQAQKLSKALKVCKKQPRKKRAACVKRANKKYATHHAASPNPPTGSATLPTGQVTPPAAGPVAPAGPTLAQVQQQVCEHHCAQGQILNVSILERGVPRLGTGVSQQRGGDNVPSDTWIFPLLVGYDEVVQKSHYALCPPEEPFCPPVLVTENETYHQREKTNAQLDHTGAWAFVFVASSTTCEPVIVTCPGPVGGGA